MSYSKEGSYIIAEGDDGNLYILISAKKDAPEAPSIIYDGGDHALFIRNGEQKIVLDYINPDVREKLRHTEEVVVVETADDQIKDSYAATVQFMEKLPVDWTVIGLTTWEKAALK